MRYCSRCHSAYEQDERFCPIDGGAIVEEDRAPADSLIGRTLAGRYLLIKTIGRGGMGVVYEAEHTGLGRRVAVKLLLDTYSDDREVLARFHQEARTASRIGHDNIIDILDIGEHDGRSFIVMELLTGDDLRKASRDLGPLPLARAIPILSQICEALQAAHEKDVIHRDMKPENVFLSKRSGRADFVKLMDFGISKIKAARDSQVRLTQTGAVIGTPLYMAPEQALGRTDIDHRVDVYAVGVMTFELLCGEPPFLAKTYMGLMHEHLSEKPPSPRSLRPDLPMALEKLILRALEKDPANRFQSMDEMRAALPDVASLPAGAKPIRARAATSKPNVAVSTAVRTGVFGAAGKWRNAILVGGGVAIAAIGLVAAKKIHDAKAPVAVPKDAPAPPPIPPPVDVTTSAPAVPPTSSSATPAPLGLALDVESQPPGATVLLDGEDKGDTPVQIKHVAPGIHTLELSLTGYAPVKTQKDVRTAVTENFVLLPLPKPTKLTSSASSSSSSSTAAIVKRPPPVTPTSSAGAQVKEHVVEPPPPVTNTSSAAKPPPVDDEHKPSPYDEHKKSPY